MSDSDEEYIAELSDTARDEDLGPDDDDDEGDIRPLAGGRGARDARRKKKQRKGQEWEVARTWETLLEGADGTISAAVGGILDAGKRKR